MRITILFFITVLFLSSCAPSQEEKDRIAVAKLHEQELIKQAQKEAEERLEAERLAEVERNRLTVEKIDAKLAELQNVDFSNLSSVPSIVEAIEFFRMNCHFALRANLEDDEELKKKANEYEAFFKKMQKREFPKLRSSYIAVSKKLLWEHNIDVSGSGTSITYTAGLFANNANIKAYHEELRSILYDLRFQRVNYKWYKYDDEYTYYTMHAPKDDALN